MTFKRYNDKNKKLYYRLFILNELAILAALFYFDIHWGVLLISTPIILMDAWSNLRCLNRQKRYIKEIQINENGITCELANRKTVEISHEKCLFSIRDVKYEKEKTEIEIRLKLLIKSRLIGRLHISNWNQIFEIRDELAKNKITQIKYRPEGYWSKYGTLTADIILTGTALAIGEIAETSGDHNTANAVEDIFMPLNEEKRDKKK